MRKSWWINLPLSILILIAAIVPIVPHGTVNASPWTLTEVATINLPDGTDIGAIVTDGTYGYAPNGDNVTKFNLNTMAISGNFTGDVGSGPKILYYASGNLYVSSSDNVIKVDPNLLTESNIRTGLTGVGGIAADNLAVYISSTYGGAPPGTGYVLNTIDLSDLTPPLAVTSPSQMLANTFWWYPVGGINVAQLSTTTYEITGSHFDIMDAGTFTCGALDGVTNAFFATSDDPPHIYDVFQSGMTLDSTWTGAAGDYINSMFFSNGKLWVNLQDVTGASWFVELDPPSMTEITRFELYGGDSVFGGIYIYSGGYFYGSVKDATTGHSKISKYAITGPSVVTLPATNVSVTSATLNGNLANMGGAPAYNVFFQYGLTVAYGGATALQSVNATGLFAANVGGLVTNATYHFRAVAANATDTIYGSDLTFLTTLAGSGGLLQFGGGNAEVFQNYITPGDMLFVAEIVNTYTSNVTQYYPTADPKLHFTIQLIGTDNTTILAATPQVDWGDKPIGIYLNPTQAAGITYGANYSIRIQANFSSNVSAQYTLRHNVWIGQDDWKGYDLRKLDAFCLSIASNMQLFYGGAGYVTVLTDRSLAITDAVGGYFTAGIAGIGEQRPNLFTTSQQHPTFSAGISALPADNTTAYTAYVGSAIATDAGVLATPLGMTARDALAGIILLVMFGVIATGTSAMGGFGALGLFLISIPLLWLGTYFKIIGVQWMMILTIIFGFFAVRQFFIKTT